MREQDIWKPAFEWKLTSIFGVGVDEDRVRAVSVIACTPVTPDERIDF
jgi:hypothetical protein